MISIEGMRCEPITCIHMFILKDVIMVSERLDAVEGKKSNNNKLLINKQYYIKCVLCSLY